MTQEAHPKTDAAAATDAVGTIYFDATLAPYRSLPPQGFLILMSAIAGGGFLIGFGFFLAGAWPVAGFAGLEILLVYIAFKLNYRESRRRQHLRLTEKTGLEIAEVAPNGHETVRRLEPTWLSVEIEDPPRHDSQLKLMSHGRVTIVGAFLTAGERLELAHALRAALERYRGGPLSPPGAAPAPPAGGSG